LAIGGLGNSWRMKDVLCRDIEISAVWHIEPIGQIRKSLSFNME
jgi:hypothetical protein